MEKKEEFSGKSEIKKRDYYVMDIIRFVEIRKVQDIVNNEILYEIICNNKKSQLINKNNKIGYLFEDLKELEKK